MELSLRPYQKQDAYLISKLRPLCYIVHLLESKGDFDKEHVKKAFLDYQEKHGASLDTRVSNLFTPKSLNKPSRHFAYWKRINPNIIKITSWGLEKEVSNDYPDAREAAGTITENFLKQYEESLSVLSETIIKKNKRSNEIYLKSKENYRSISNSWIINENYLKSNFPLIFTERIEDLIKSIDTKIKEIDENIDEE